MIETTNQLQQYILACNWNCTNIYQTEKHPFTELCGISLFTAW